MSRDQTTEANPRRIAIPLRVGTAGPMSAASPAPPVSPPAAVPWRPSWLLAAPHRLGFFLAMVVLMAASLWWLAVLADRATGWLAWRFTVPQALAHSAVMVWGFMPLFFAGFLFTAGPKWLHVEGPTARDLLPSLSLQCAGWLIWLLGVGVDAHLAIAGAALAWLGLMQMSVRWWGLVRRSTLADRVHAQSIGVACAVGSVALGAFVLALLLHRPDLAERCVLSAVWGFVVVVFATVAHRMIPFFTSGVLPMIQVWRPFWVLWVMLGGAVFEVLCVWAESRGVAGPVWLAIRALVEALIGGLLLWLAVVWGLVQSLRIRLLAMLHVGFVWMGLAYLLSAATQAIALVGHGASLPLAALHALTMGCLGSLILAMVTRVSCGHSGRSLVADDRVWILFWLLQLAVLLRLLASGFADRSTSLLLAAAAVWTLVMLAWGVRYMGWYGRPRSDGKPG